MTNKTNLQSYIATRKNELVLVILHFVAGFCTYIIHTCEPVAKKNLEKFSGELAKKLENFVGPRYIEKCG